MISTIKRRKHISEKAKLIFTRNARGQQTMKLDISDSWAEVETVGGLGLLESKIHKLGNGTMQWASESQVLCLFPLVVVSVNENYGVCNMKNFKLSK